MELNNFIVPASPEHQINRCIFRGRVTKSYHPELLIVRELDLLKQKLRWGNSHNSRQETASELYCLFHFYRHCNPLHKHNSRDRSRPVLNRISLIATRLYYVIVWAVCYLPDLLAGLVAGLADSDGLSHVAHLEAGEAADGDVLAQFADNAWR